MTLCDSRSYVENLVEGSPHKKKIMKAFDKYCNQSPHMFFDVLVTYHKEILDEVRSGEPIELTNYRSGGGLDLAALQGDVDGLKTCGTDDNPAHPCDGRLDEVETVLENKCDAPCASPCSGMTGILMGHDVASQYCDLISICERGPTTILKQGKIEVCEVFVDGCPAAGDQTVYTCDAHTYNYPSYECIVLKENVCCYYDFANKCDPPYQLDCASFGHCWAAPGSVCQNYVEEDVVYRQTISEDQVKDVLMRGISGLFISSFYSEDPSTAAPNYDSGVPPFSDYSNDNSLKASCHMLLFGYKEFLGIVGQECVLGGDFVGSHPNPHGWQYPNEVTCHILQGQVVSGEDQRQCFYVDCQATKGILFYPFSELGCPEFLNCFFESGAFVYNINCGHYDECFPDLYAISPLYAKTVAEKVCTGTDAVVPCNGEGGCVCGSEESSSSGKFRTASQKVSSLGADAIKLGVSPEISSRLTNYGQLIALQNNVLEREAIVLDQLLGDVTNFVQGKAYSAGIPYIEALSFNHLTQIAAFELGLGFDFSLRALKPLKFSKEYREDCKGNLIDFPEDIGKLFLWARKFGVDQKFLSKLKCTSENFIKCKTQIAAKLHFEDDEISNVHARRVDDPQELKCAMDNKGDYLYATEHTEDKVSACSFESAEIDAINARALAMCYKEIIPGELEFYW